MVQQQERRERPEHIDNEKKRPKLKEFPLERRRVEERSAEHKGANGDENTGSDDEDIEDESRDLERREKIFNLGKIGERPYIEAQVHELEKREKSLYYWIRDFGQILRSSENPIA